MSYPPVTYPLSFVAFDLETTGLNPYEHKIIEIGAVKVIDGQIVDEFDRLVDPRKEIPFHITQLTGITPQDVNGAEYIEEVLPEFLEFIGDLPLVAHNAPFDTKFLAHEAHQTIGLEDLPNPVIDTFELSRFIVPRMKHHRLSSLLDYFRVQLEEAHRAFDDAEGAAYLLLHLVHEMASFELPLFEQIEFLISEQDWPYRSILKLCKEQSVKSSLSRAIGRKPAESELLYDAVNILGRASELKSDQYQPIDPRETIQILKRLANALPGYEYRPQQEEMSRWVAEAFAKNSYAVVEAGTGTGKSLAYLIPAIQHGIQNKDRIVISTNTKNLQEQLFYHDIPLLQDKLELTFKAVLLKGRSNYLCRRRWDEVMANLDFELTPDECLESLPLVTWTRETKSGDINECNAFRQQQNPQLWRKINADSTNCSIQDCRYYKKGECYLFKVREEAETAQLVVINHSLLFSDLITDNGILGEYDRLIIDEAHNLERVANDYLGTSLTIWDIRALTQRLHFKKDTRDAGQLVILRQWVAKSDTNLEWKDFIQDQIKQAIQLSEELWDQSVNYFRYLTTYLRDMDAAKKYSGTARVRFRRDSDVVADFREAHNDLKVTLEDLGQVIFKLKTELEDQDDQTNGKERLQQELSGRLIDIQTLTNTIDFFLEVDDEKFVFWLEGPRKADSFDTKWCSAPLEIAPLLKKYLYDDKKTIVFTSATITVGKSFEFFNDRAGLSLVDQKRLLTKEVGSPFDYDRQIMITVPNYIADPRSNDYVENVSHLLKSITLLTKRGTLALFTSYGMLNKTYSLVKDVFEAHKIMLMGQGQDGTRSNLLNRFKEDQRSVLFGTDSFWEGVDIPGAALEVLFITRLPFLVPDEPLIEAHQEVLTKKGINAFEHYMIPKAVLKFRQGVGRLIRRKDDYGLVVITDNRIIRSKFGNVFMRSLPTSLRVIQTEKELLTNVRDWFAAKEKQVRDNQ